jgi:hypothetical protein
MIKRQRTAFSLLTAIFLILLMSSVSIFVMNLSGKIVKETTTAYQKEQAVLLAKSYTELAIMSTMANDRNGTNSCINDITGVIGPAGASTNGKGYLVETYISFIGPAADIAPCYNNRELGYPTTDDLNIIVDVYVRYKDINSPDPASSPWMTYHRRTIQKI